MNRTFSFKKTKKSIMTVEMPDDSKLLLTAAGKGLLDKFMNIQNKMDAQDPGETLNDLYEIMADLLSHNLNKKQITKEELEGWMDYEDLFMFIQDYTAFIQEITNQKN